MEYAIVRCRCVKYYFRININYVHNYLCSHPVGVTCILEGTFGSARQQSPHAERQVGRTVSEEKVCTVSHLINQHNSFKFFLLPTETMRAHRIN